jgi:hypothetical protein
MNVETYEIEQATSEAAEMAMDGAAVELIEKLGLVGQRKLINPETDTRNPYRAMTEEEKVVYKAVLAEESSLEKFSSETIPLRVLQVAAHAKECGLFSRLVVWSAPAAVVITDPLLLGMVKNPEYSWMETPFMLARWGRELLPFSEMKRLAIDILRPERIDKLEAIIRTAQLRLEIIKTTTSLKALSLTPEISGME